MKRLHMTEVQVRPADNGFIIEASYAPRGEEYAYEHKHFVALATADIGNIVKSLFDTPYIDIAEESINA